MKSKLKIIITKLLLFYILFSLVGCKESRNDRNNQYSIPIYNFEELRPLLQTKSDTTFVVNFWATWCSPCVKEIPHFERLQKEHSGKQLKVILVNLDFPNHYDTRLIPFVTERKIKSKVVMLDDPNANYWINEVDPQWSGAIPATLVFNKSQNAFFEKELSYEELESIVLNFIN